MVVCIEQIPGSLLFPHQAHYTEFNASLPICESNYSLLIPQVYMLHSLAPLWSTLIKMAQRKVGYTSLKNRLGAFTAGFLIVCPETGLEGRASPFDPRLPCFRGKPERGPLNTWSHHRTPSICLGLRLILWEYKEDTPNQMEKGWTEHCRRQAHGLGFQR